MGTDMIAYTYAKALKDLFIQEGRKKDSFFHFLEELKLLNQVLNQESIKSFFLSFAITVEEKKKVLKSLFDSLDFNTLTFPFLCLLLDKKRWKELDAILFCLSEMVDEMKGMVVVKVEHTGRLPSSLKKELIEKLENFLNKKISLKEEESGIGGLKISTKDLVFNDTLLFHLKQMENQIRRNFDGYTSK